MTFNLKQISPPKKTQDTGTLKVLVLAALVFLPGLLSKRDFWIEDETRYAEVIREMIYDGKWIVPYLNGHFYPDKPPLFFYLASLSSVLTGGITLFSTMLITWISALICIWFLYKTALLLFNQKVAFYSVLVFCSIFLTLCCAQIVRMDMLLTASITAAMYFFVKRRIKKINTYAFFWLACSVAVFAKGPLGLILPLISVALVILSEKNFSELKKLFTNWAVFAPVGVISGWFGCAWLLGEHTFIHNVIVDQILGRAGLSATPVKQYFHPEPFYFYALLFPVLLLPWTPFLPRALVELRRTQGLKNNPLLWWFTGGFVMLSIVSGKLFIYLIPLMCPVAIIIGHYIHKIMELRTKDTWFCLESAISLILTFGIFTAAPVFVKNTPYWEPLIKSSLSMVSAIVIAAGLIMLIRYWKAIPALLFTGMGIVSAVLFLIVAPGLNNQFSGKEIGRLITEYKAQGDTVMTLGVRCGIFSYDAGFVIPEIDKNEAIALSKRKTSVLLTRESTYNKELKETTRFKIRFKTVIAGEKYVFLVLE